MKGVKGVDVFCSSPASTAICVSMDQKSMVRSSSRVLDRHTPRLIDSRRSMKPPLPPASAASSSSTSSSSSSSSSGAGASSSNSASSSKPNPSKAKPRRLKSIKRSEKHKELLMSPPGSSRYLLGEDNAFPDSDPVSALIQHGLVLSRTVKNKAEASQQVFKPSSPPRPHEEVVVLRVSLHCKGCEMKVRKHISRMEGVKSFNIDFQAKKVTVIGDVTPIGVLTSISRVKNAQFWPSPPVRAPQ
ncbi:hypothetical protein H6P81_006749 [Aristolochia fimbriata]|uniref:HMA domain-containing protein n=1 Tax=Aristolochia fimbriata TaxID=158543 RepID=A0AAV7EY64_ARIFI|nr:hypothetical protein H6P81_006749 [Aristolochia fimbriata]